MIGELQRSSTDEERDEESREGSARSSTWLALLNQVLFGWWAVASGTTWEKLLLQR